MRRALVATAVIGAAGLPFVLIGAFTGGGGFGIARAPIGDQLFPRAGTGLLQYHAVVRVARDGTLTVRARAVFEDDEGGSVLVDSSGLRGLRAVGMHPRIAREVGARRVSAEGRSLRLEYRVLRAFTAWSDIAELEWPVIEAANGATTYDESVRVRVSIVLPRALRGRADAILNGASDERVSVVGRSVRIAGDVVAHRDAVVHAALPRNVVGRVSDTRVGEGRTGYRIRKRTFAAIDRATFASRGSERRVRRVVNLVLAAVAFGPPAFLWLLVFAGAATRRRARRELDPTGVPDYVREPPTDDDPAVVALLWNEGTVPKRAVAASVLALAQRGAFTIEETGAHTYTLTVVDRDVEATLGEREVLRTLSVAAGRDRTIEAPPLWAGADRSWWWAYRKDATARAQVRGLVQRLFRRGPLAAASVWTGVGIGIFFFLTRPAMFMLVVVAFAIAGVALSVMGGYELTREGRRRRAYWGAFRRHVVDFTQIDRAPPATIELWGAHLTYGAALDAAEEVQKALAPG